MNRICQTILCILIFVLPVYGQEPDTILPVTDTLSRDAEAIPPDPGRFSRAYDSIFRVTDPVIQEQDTLSRGPEPVSRISRRALRTADTTETVPEPDFSHSPSRAIMYALVLPGLGQAYNKKYFKIPLVYAALGGAVYAIHYNTGEYRKAVLDYAENQGDDRYLRGWRRYMEISYIALAAVYALQVLDAYVDAHLYSWDVNENLSMRIAPSLQPMMVSPSGFQHQLGLTCRFELKGR
ncbi:MAG TPA: hypothetical protein ENO20_04225 [Bacteroides sp.]|nr:hypothetical protein [Bacteroides sp.]